MGTKPPKKPHHANAEIVSTARSGGATTAPSPIKSHPECEPDSAQHTNGIRATSSNSAHLDLNSLETDALTREIIENANDIIYIHDLQGNFTYGNGSVRRVLGYSEDETLKLNISDVVAPEDQKRAIDAISAKLAGGSPGTPYRLRVRAKNGDWKHLEVSTRLISKAGMHLGVQGIARDITERLQVEAALLESEAKFRALAEGAPCVIAIYQEKRLCYVNPATEHITGFSQKELLSMERFWELIAPEFQPLVRSRAAARLRGEEGHGRYDLKLRRKDGEERWMDFSSTPIDYQGQPAVVTVGFDITERRRTEQSLIQSEQRFRQLFERNLAGVFVSTVEGTLLDCNEAFARICGYQSREEIMRRPTQDLYMSTEDRESFIGALRKAKSFTNIEVLLRRKDGSPVWALENVILVESTDAQPDQIQGTLVEITERKYAEQALIESETKFRAVAETAASAIFIHNGAEFLYMNRACTELSGYSHDELMRLRPMDLVHPDDWEFVGNRSLERLRGEAVAHRYEYRLLTKSRTVRWVDFSASIIKFGGQNAILGTAFDVTERKRAETIQAALYRIADNANSIDDLDDFFPAIHRIVGELVEARNFYIALYDHDQKTLTYPYYSDQVDATPQGALPIARGLTEYVLRTGQPLLVTPESFSKLVTTGEVESVGADCVDWVGVPLKSGTATFGVIALQSYTDTVRYSERELEILSFVSQHMAGAILHKRNEEALRASEMRNRLMVQSAVYGIYRSNPEGRFLEVNPALVTMLGYDSAEEVLTLHIGKDVYANEEERFRRMMEHKRERVENVEVTWKRKDGKIITVRLSGRGVTDAQGEIESYEMIAEDVTEKRALEEQLRQSQKMEAVGRLAGGVAHDFNNLLTVIKGYSELILDELKEADPLRPEIDEIKKAADRAASLTRQLLAFSRQQVMAPKVLDLNAVVSNMDKLLTRLLGEDITLHTILEAGLGRVKADPGQIEQVIMNLAVNARDAMPRGGKLTVETANVHLDEAYVRDHVGAKPGPYVMLSVCDTGTGMSEEVRQRVFEPFFTTKEIGKGTGLGLSTVYGIVKQSEGYIWVSSDPGGGTEFKMYLPRVDAPADISVVRQLSKESYRGDETVLLVEDEDGVRALVRQVLHKHGYTVLEARHGGEALLHCERHNGSIDLLLTDVVLEQMGGPELARRLSVIRPSMKVLYMSGYTDDAILKHGVLSPGTAFLQKPFTTESLAKKIRQVIEGH